MSKAKPTDFLQETYLERNSRADGELIEQIFGEFGWDVDLPFDIYQYFIMMDFNDKVEVIQNLGETFAGLTDRDRDTMFSLLFWCTEDQVFYHLVETNALLQQFLRQLFASREVYLMMMAQYGCGSRLNKQRVHYCWELAQRDFQMATAES